MLFVRFVFPPLCVMRNDCCLPAPFWVTRVAISFHKHGGPPRQATAGLGQKTVNNNVVVPPAQTVRASDLQPRDKNLVNSTIIQIDNFKPVTVGGETISEVWQSVELVQH